MAHLRMTLDGLLAGVDHIRRSPADDGRVELIVRRPATGEREVLVEAELDLIESLVGDMWRTRPSSKTGDGSAHPDMQVTVMNARCAALVAVEPERRALAGDQLYVDLTMGRSRRIGGTPIRCRSLLDLRVENLPPGTRLEVGSAVIEISAVPHTGCAKFAQQFGRDATRFVNSPVGRALNLRGVNAKVVVAGTVKTGDTVRKN